MGLGPSSAQGLDFPTSKYNRGLVMGYLWGPTS